MYFPSGVHSGETNMSSVVFDSCSVSLPSAAITQRLFPPLRSLMKAMRRPSGLQRGCASCAIPLVRRVAEPPVAGIV